MNMLKHASDLAKLPTDVIRKAYALMNRQSFVPPSPGCLTESGYYYCAAAALAAAGLEVVRSPDASRDFTAKLAGTKKSDAIMNIFAELGWDPTIARHVLIINDSIESQNRKVELLSQMGEFLAQSA
jgi:hypothetical protein